MFKDRSGQSLIELLAAIMIIQIGIFSIWSLFLVSYNSTQESKMRIVGVNLAREGVEIVKNIRDSNWLKRANNVKLSGDGYWTWDQGLANGSYITSYNSQDLTAVSSSTSLQLYLNDGFYSTDNTGSSTLYSRKITINSIYCLDSDHNFSCDSSNYSTSGGVGDLRIGIDVISEVTWSVASNERKAIIEETLYDWQ